MTDPAPPVADSLATPLAWADADGVIAGCNPAFASWLGVSARRLAGLLTIPRFLPAAGPVGMRSRPLMTVALRVMGNLVTDSDRDLTARLWRTAGRLSVRLDDRPPLS